ncbi:MAG: GlsB/YeaQ/YmgE family stress response membrane protein [Dermatophilaceae bacterium]
MSILAWIVIGGLAGWIASKIMGTDAQQGLLMNIVVGIVGGLLGGWILALFGGNPMGDGWIVSLLTATFGSVVLLGIVGMLTGRRSVRA